MTGVIQNPLNITIIQAASIITLRIQRGSGVSSEIKIQTLLLLYSV